MGNAYEFELPVFGGGTHDVSAVATDAAGNASAASNLAIFVVDNLLPSAPVVTVTSPTNEGPPVTVVVSADPGDGVASVNLYVDGVDSGVTPSVSGSTFTFLLPLAEGSYVLDATATDAASLVSPPSAARVLVVDRSPPPMPTGFTVPDATSALSLPLAGMAEPGSTIWFEVGYMPILSTVAAADGTWSADVPLPAGSVRLNVGFNYWATDAAGNLDGKYLGGLVVDREPPAAPTVAPIAPSPTKAANVTVAVTVAQAETGLTVQLFDDGVEVTATPTVSGTTWTFVLDPGEGSTDFTATATDALGNVSDLSAPASVTVDRTAPAVPSIAPIAPSPTNAADVTVVVTVAEAEAGLAVRLLDGGVEVTATPSIVGTTWTFVLDPGEGTHAFTATAADVLGNVSALSAPVSVEVDRTAPAVPSIAPVTTPTRATTVTAVVTATAGATVQLRVDGTDVAAVDPGYAVDFAGATWTFTFDPGEGLFDLTATASDALGNTSAPSVAMTVAVDRTPPAVPAIAPIASPTRAESVTVVVSVAPADAGATVRLFLDGLQASVSPVVSGTDYTFVLDPGEGTHAFTATAADALGNGSAPSAPITVEVDRTPPGAPSIAPILPNPTNAATVTVAVTADAGATVVLFADGTPSAVVPTVSGGVHTFALDPGEGSTAFTATAADALGNVSALSPAQSVGVDRTPPNVPSIAPLATPTNAAQVAVTVTADAGSTVKLWVNGVQTSLVPTVAGVTYGFTWAPPADGSYSLQATAADALGNTSARSTARTVVVDRTAPSATPTVAGLPAVTAAASVAVTGTADAGTTVTVAVAGMAPVTAVVAGDGTWSADVPLPAADGDAAVTVTAAVAAGNLSPAFSGSVTVDRTAPAAPVVTAPVAGASLPPGTVTVSGTAEPGATVTVTVDGTAQAVTADGTGAFQLDASLTDGNHFISVTAADAAGNVSAQADVAFVVQTPASDDGGGGGCGCGPGGAGPEALLLVTLGLVLFRRRRAVR